MVPWFIDHYGNGAMEFSKHNMLIGSMEMTYYPLTKVAAVVFAKKTP